MYYSMNNQLLQVRHMGSVNTTPADVAYSYCVKIIAKLKDTQTSENFCLW